MGKILAEHRWGPPGGSSRSLSLMLILSPRDCWWGTFWQCDRFSTHTQFCAYICLVPCLPLLVTIKRPRKPTAPAHPEIGA